MVIKGIETLVNLKDGLRLDGGLQALLADDHAGAFRRFRNGAEQGDPWSQHCLGVAYEHGIGCEIDLVSALFWYALASRGGTDDAAAAMESLEPRLTRTQVRLVSVRLDRRLSRARH